MTLKLIWIKVGSFLDPFSIESLLGCQALDLVSLIRTAFPHMPCPLQFHLDQLALRAKTLEPDSVQFSSIQFSSVAQSRPTLCDPMNHSSPGLPVHHQLLESTQTYVHWVGDAIQPSHPLSSPSPLPSVFSSIRVFSNESTHCMRWPKYWSFSFNISPSNEYPGLISFRMDSLDLLAVQETLKSLLQHHSSKASVLWCSAFFIAQLSHPYMTTGKTIALTRQMFVGKVMSLLFNMLSRLVITFLPRSKRLLISWLQSPSAVILEPKKIKSHTVPIVSPSICHEVMGPDVMILVLWILSFKPTFSLSSFTFIKRLFSSSSLSAIRGVPSAYLRLLIFLPAILIPACASSNPAFLMMYSAYKLNKQGDNIQPWRTPFPILNPSVVPCPVLTVASWPAYRFLKRQVRWSGIPISFRIFHNLLWSTVKGFGIVNKAEIDVLLELSCFFSDPARLPRFKSHLLHLVAVNSWSNYLTSQYLSILNCQIMIIILVFTVVEI